MKIIINKSNSKIVAVLKVYQSLKIGQNKLDESVWKCSCHTIWGRGVIVSPAGSVSYSVSNVAFATVYNCTEHGILFCDHMMCFVVKLEMLVCLKEMFYRAMLVIKNWSLLLVQLALTMNWLISWSNNKYIKSAIFNVYLGLKCIMKITVDLTKLVSLLQY